MVGQSRELSKLKQEGSNYDAYQEEFMRLSHQVQDLPESYLVGCFVSGLRDTVKYEIIAKNPNSIEEAMRLAQIEEEKLASFRRTQKAPYQKNANYPGFGRGTSRAGGVANTNKGGGVGTPQNTPVLVRKLIPQEMREKREKGYASIAMGSTLRVTSINHRSCFGWRLFLMEK